MGKNRVCSVKMVTRCPPGNQGVFQLMKEVTFLTVCITFMRNFFLTELPPAGHTIATIWLRG